MQALKTADGFGVLYIFFVLVVMGTVGFIGWRLWNVNHFSDRRAQAVKETTYNQKAAQKSFKIPQEGLTFNYPSDWSVKPGYGFNLEGAALAINSPGKGSEAFQINVFIGDTNYDEGFRIIDSVPITFVGKQAYLLLGSYTKGSTEINQALMSLEPNAVRLPLSKDGSKNVNIIANYNNSEVANDERSFTGAASVMNDRNFATARAIIESTHY